MDLKKKEIKEILTNELFLMKDPMNKNNRIDSWKDVLSQLILLKKIENFHINHDGLEIQFNINNFTYFIDYESESKIKLIIRENLIDQLLGS